MKIEISKDEVTALSRIWENSTYECIRNAKGCQGCPFYDGIHCTSIAIINIVKKYNLKALKGGDK